MKVLVAYWSQTGNTRKVAEAIFGALPGDKTIKPLHDIDTLDGFDLTFVGFPVMQFGPPPVVRKFIEEHAAGKKIALFITHAMLSGSDDPQQKAMLTGSNDPQQKAMLEKELDKCRAVCSKSKLIGLFHCQGELSEKVANELLSSGIPMLMEFAAMRPLTIGHPDANELEQAQLFVRRIIKP